MMNPHDYLSNSISDHPAGVAPLGPHPLSNPHPSQLDPRVVDLGIAAGRPGPVIVPPHRVVEMSARLDRHGAIGFSDLLLFVDRPRRYTGPFPTLTILEARATHPDWISPIEIPNARIVLLDEIGAIAQISTPLFHRHGQATICTGSTDADLITIVIRNNSRAPAIAAASIAYAAVLADPASASRPSALPTRRDMIDAVSELRTRDVAPVADLNQA